ncbi:MAG: hypothetical protein IJL35_01550 [Bacteroidaceae bacterium]|nr:hypothetical protein [Bacteroidaceae bacterium]
MALVGDFASWIVIEFQWQNKAFFYQLAMQISRIILKTSKIVFLLQILRVFYSLNKIIF